MQDLFLLKCSDCRIALCLNTVKTLYIQFKRWKQHWSILLLSSTFNGAAGLHWAVSLLAITHPSTSSEAAELSWGLWVFPHVHSSHRLHSTAAGADLMQFCTY